MSNTSVKYLKSEDIGSVADPGCLSRIPDPTFSHPRSRIRTVSIPDPGSSSKNLSILTPKKAKKWFLSSKKYDPGCSSRIPDPGVKKASNPGSRIRIRNTGYRSTKRATSESLTFLKAIYLMYLRNMQQISAQHKRKNYFYALKELLNGAPVGVSLISEMLFSFLCM